MSNARIILASASPRRAELLRGMGHKFEIMPAHVDEAFIPGADPAKEAERLAVDKCEEIARRIAPAHAIVIGADTVVALEGEILGKPESHEHAREMLRKLSGSTHEVITGLCVADTRAGARVVDSVSTTVTMRPMTGREICDYVDSGEADGKAGAYAIQETADRYVTRVDGSFNNVVGLPTERLAEILEELLQ